MKKAYVLLRNITSNFTTQFLLLVISFFTTPYIFHKFGAVQYAILVILNTIIGYFSVFDFGLSSALIKYLAQFKAANKKLGSLLGTAFFSYFFLTILSGGIIFITSRFFIEKVFQIPLFLTDTALLALKLTALNFIFSSLGNFFSLIPQSLQRFEFYNLKNILLGIIIPIGTIILLIFNQGLISIVYLYLIVNALIAILFYFLSRKLLPVDAFNFTFSIAMLKKLLAFGWFKFISNITSRIVFQLNNFLIAVFMPINLVSFYSIPASLTQKAIDLLPNLTLPIFPLTSELSALASKEKLVRLYQHSIKSANLLMMPLFLFLFFFSRPFLAVWIDQQFSQQTYLILKILSLAYLINSFSSIPAVITEGLGKPKIPAFFSTISAFLYLSLALLFIPKWHIFGAAIAILINAVLIVPIFVYVVSFRLLPLKPLSFCFNFYFKPFILSLVSILPFLLLSSFIISLWHFGFIFIIYLIFYFILCFIFKIIDKTKLQILRNFINFSSAP